MDEQYGGGGMMYRRPLPSQKQLREALDYVPETGRLYWRKNGREAFKQKQTRGYLIGRFEGTYYMAHRIIMKMVYNIEPDHTDHINHIRSDNRLENLRFANNTINHQNRGFHKNNTSGVIGVVWESVLQKWKAQIWVGGRAEGKMIYLGCYNTIEEAAVARKLGSEQFGFHKNHGAKNVG